MLDINRRLVECGYPAIPLPPLDGRLHAAAVKGRHPFHGYARGWALEFGELGARIEEHPLYREALSAALGRTIVSQHRLMNLFLIVTCFFDEIADRNVLEFGSYRGGSALFLGLLLKRLYPEASVYAHDTFAGMPEVSAAADLHSKGDFGDADLRGLVALRDGLGLDRLHFVEGLVQDTFPGSVPQGMRFGLAHFDMDIYESTAFAQTAAWPQMTRGGYFVYDDATVSSCIGATQAVEELIISRGLHSEQVYPHFVFRVPPLE